MGEAPIELERLSNAANRLQSHHGKQSDEPEDFTNEPLPSMSELMEVQDALASTSATPFALPIIAASKSKAQKQREYKQRIAADRTPAPAQDT
ncbi:hypothetical protein HHI36_012818 [Cryptolaemus montrouzieri]|uniref:Uncharacterized protein n=1 Tax=Cryptolaemus montrouzieri TaxID=559131 RepID=A0ABD2NGC6_9CUCU